MKLIDIPFIEDAYKSCKEESLFGKWLCFSDIKPIYEKLQSKIPFSILGTSENSLPIYKAKFGSGKKRILIWTQMHGNEATGTKAVFDFFNFITRFSKHNSVKTILKECTLIVIPMLNPDGALAYTRENAKNIDLNRDAVALKAKESKLLRSILDEFKPDFCFNLHDQRTIFGVEGTNKPASISFLAPSEDEARKLTKGRKETMNVIVAMNELLQQFIPSHIGRYTDEFYPTATGDNFQKLGHNTILIEAGHYPNDYSREEVRKYNFYALLQGIYHIAINNKFVDYQSYFNIPNNVKNFYDVIHRYKNGNDIAYQYKEKIIENTFVRYLEEENKNDLSGYIAHKEIFFED